MNLPEWAKWLARDEDGELWAYSERPFKRIDMWDGDYYLDIYREIEETDDTFKHIKWTDEEPTEIKRGLEAGGVSVEELNRIINAKAHGYDEVPEVEDKNERMHVDIDGLGIVVGEITSISFEEAMDLVENDMINQPPHYVGKQGLEVEAVLQNFIPRYEDPYVGHRVASAIEYLLRSPLKNQRQDIEKAGKNIQQALAYLDMTEEDA